MKKIAKIVEIYDEAKHKYRVKVKLKSVYRIIYRKDVRNCTGIGYHQITSITHILV